MSEQFERTMRELRQLPPPFDRVDVKEASAYALHVAHAAIQEEIERRRRAERDSRPGTKRRPNWRIVAVVTAAVVVLLGWLILQLPPGPPPNTDPRRGTVRVDVNGHYAGTEHCEGPDLIRRYYESIDRSPNHARCQP